MAPSVYTEKMRYTVAAANQTAIDLY